MRIAVIGAGGFIGGWISEELSERTDLEQRACVRRWASSVRIARRGIPIALANIEDERALPSVLSNVDAVINASMVAPSKEANLAAVLWRAAATAGVDRFVQLSSAAVYGDATGDIDETWPARPLDEYGRGKVEMERTLVGLAARGKPEVVILRPSIVYGPFSDAWTVRYARRISAGRWLHLSSLAKGTCNLIYAQDLARAAIAASTISIRQPSLVLNLNGPEALQWNDYIARFGEALGVQCRLVPNVNTFRAKVIAAEMLKRLARYDYVKRTYRSATGRARATLGGVKMAVDLYPSLAEIALLGRNVRYTANRSESVLSSGTPTAVEEGLRRSAAWCHVHDIL